MNTTNDPRAGWTSASSAQSDRLCQGRHNAQKGLPDTKGEWAEYGQQVHAALAETNRDETSNNTISTLTPEQRDMFDSCREVEKKVIGQIWGGEPENNNRVWRHQRYWCKVPGEQVVPADNSGPGSTREHTVKVFFQHSGEADFVMRRGSKALILDYKVLSGETPDSPKNEQLRDLAIMVWRNLMVEEVIVAIIQPLETWSPELCRYTKPDLERAEQEMWDRVRKSNDPNAPRTPGAVQCKFCKARMAGKCKEYAQWTAMMVPTMSDLSTPVSEWTPDQRALFCERKAIAQMWLDDCEGQMKKLLTDDPESVPGWMLKDGNKREVINNPQELFNRFTELSLETALSMAEGRDVHKANELILEWFMDCVKITKGDLETQVRTITKTKGKSLKAQVESLLNGIVDVKQNAPSLVRKEDK